LSFSSELEMASPTPNRVVAPLPTKGGSFPFPPALRTTPPIADGSDDDHPTDEEETCSEDESSGGSDAEIEVEQAEKTTPNVGKPREPGIMRQANGQVQGKQGVVEVSKPPGQVASADVLVEIRKMIKEERRKMPPDPLSRCC
jgi:hypothetical protein